MARTEGESDTRRREMADFMILPRPAKCVQKGTGFSRKPGIYWACRKGKSGLSATERAVGKNVGAAHTKRKWNRAVCPEYQIMRGESQGGQEPHRGEKEGDQSKSMEWKGWTPPSRKADAKEDSEGKQEELS